MDEKTELERQWREGHVRILLTKAKVFGFGMNWQHCNQVVFCGLGYSYEQYYQAIRRCWRFGQTRPVDVHVILSEPERSIFDTILAKERQAAELSGGLLAELRDHSKTELFGGTIQRRRLRTVPGPRATRMVGVRMKHVMDQAHGQTWALYNGDSAEVLPQLPPHSIDFSVFSPPFSSTYTYSPSDRDLGNVKN